MSNKENITISEASEGSLLALWSVSKDGYRITSDLKNAGEPGPGTDPPFLVPKGSVRKVYPVLLGNKLIHRNFAKLDNEDAILNFANKYGLLGRSLFLCPLRGGAVVLGESLSIWKDRLSTLGRLLAIWDLVRTNQVDKLKHIVIYQPNQVVVSTEDGCQDLLASKRINPNLLERWGVNGWRRGNVIEPALYFVCSEVNKNLDSQFSFKILPFKNKEIYTMPTTLESAIWLMFAYEISGKLRPVQCKLKRCSDWFEQRDARQRYCSNAHKQEDYRRRKGGTK